MEYEKFFEHRASQWNERAQTGHMVTDNGIQELVRFHQIDPTEPKTVLIIGVGHGKTNKRWIDHSIDAIYWDRSFHFDWNFVRIGNK